MLLSRCSHRLCASITSTCPLIRGVPTLRVRRSSDLAQEGLVARSSMVPKAAASQAAEGEHKHTNRLAKEQSPYLLQHAHNPVSVP